MAHKMRPVELAQRPNLATPNGQPDRWYRVRNKAETESADVYLYDQIGVDWWTGKGIDSKQFAKDLAEITASTINVHVNSTGGDAWEGVAIYNTLVQHPANIHVIVDGIAASAASFIAMAGDTVTMRTGAQMMIHDAWGVCVGNASDMSGMVDFLDCVSDSVASIYAARTGDPVGDWRDAMKAETWYTAQEAVDAGLADEVSRKSAAKSDASRLAAFAYAGRDAAPAPAIRNVTRSADLVISHQTNETEEKGVTVSDTLRAALVAALGVDETSTDDQVVAAVEALKAPSTVAPALPDTTITVDAGVYAELVAKADAGASARAELDASRRDALITTALTEGRISAATSTIWRTRLDADETGVTALLATLPKNTVPVDEIGHSDTVDESTVPSLADMWAPLDDKDK